MRLYSLKITNFKGIKDLNLNSGGRNMTVFGRNGTGKTTFADSINWLLFGKDSHNNDGNVKPYDKDGNEIHNLETSVTAAFDNDGKMLTLAKIQKEIWQTARGTTTPKFKGNTVDYYFNEVPVSESKYNAAISEIAREDIFRMVTNPLYFGDDDALKTAKVPGWKVRRDILFELAGDISDEKIIDSAVTIGNKDMLSLINVLNSGRSLDDHRLVVKDSLAKTKNSKDDIPVQIK
jgi:hypothetical protein